MYKDKEDGETHTGAYIASRVTKNIVESFFKEKINNDNLEITQDDIGSLEKSIKHGLKEKLDKQDSGNSNIRSNLIRTFPTTMAVGQISQASKKIQLLWAGDSRVYLLSSEKGLIQLTKDDLKSNNDPFQNIENDSPLSNMINLDEDFIINFKDIEIEKSNLIVFFAATDGCFGYFPTPMHFEYMLLQTMEDSDSIDQWKQKISEKLKNISGDDYSMALVCLTQDGADFSQLKNSFQIRYKTLCDEYMKKLADKEKIVADLEKKEEEIKSKLARQKTDRKYLYEALWKQYKKTNYPFNSEEL
ncbi:MAG: protein phosphatase 2C family protein [Rickettsiales bacterium]|nr:protein phosphatase 2C family protein [Rickettsiales bacterium]